MDSRAEVDVLPQKLIVILSEAKDLLFEELQQRSQKQIPRRFASRDNS
jgi:hypothetical protein